MRFLANFWHTACQDFHLGKISDSNEFYLFTVLTGYNTFWKRIYIYNKKVYEVVKPCASFLIQVYPTVICLRF